MTEDDLLTDILASTSAPRTIVVEFLHAQLVRAQQSTTEELANKIGEKIASTIQTALLQQEYVNFKDDPELAHIESIAGDLIQDTSDTKAWSELLDRIQQLQTNRDKKTRAL